MSKNQVLLFGLKTFKESLETIDINDEWSSMTSLFRCDSGLQIIYEYGDRKLKEETLQKLKEKLEAMEKITAEYKLKGIPNAKLFLDQNKRNDAIKLIKYYTEILEKSI